MSITLFIKTSEGSHSFSVVTQILGKPSLCSIFTNKAQTGCALVRFAEQTHQGLCSDLSANMQMEKQRPNNYKSIGDSSRK